MTKSEQLLLISKTESVLKQPLRSGSLTISAFYCEADTPLTNFLPLRPLIRNNLTAVRQALKISLSLTHFSFSQIVLLTFAEDSPR